MAQISNQQQSLELRAVVKPPNCVMIKEGHQQDALWIKCKDHLFDGNWNSYPKLQLPIITLLGNILYCTKLSFFLLRYALTLAQKKELLFSFNCRTGQSCEWQRQGVFPGIQVNTNNFFNTRQKSYDFSKITMIFIKMNTKLAK
jgi:hypothetical protein